VWLKHAYNKAKMVASLHITTRSSDIAEGLRDTLSVEILSTAAQLYKKSHLERLAVGE